jgi:hypothetical protein
MTRQAWWWPLISAVVLTFAARADDLPIKQRQAIDKGLEWLAKGQAPDGHWGGQGGQRPGWTQGRQRSTNHTARAAMALLMQGSTLRRGPYSSQLQKAVDWLVANSQANGLIRNAKDRAEAKEYMEGHGFAMLFLASVYRQEQDGERRKQLKDVLTRAVDFCGKAQTTLGGWGYVSANEGGDWDVGDLTASQMQGLRACQDAGIAGTEPILAKGFKYLQRCTTRNGGVVFCLASGGGGGERPNLTAAALIGGFCAGQSDSELVKKWLKYCASHIAVGQEGLMDPDGSGRYYYAQALHLLGDDGYARLFPDSQLAERPTWSRYKEVSLGQLIGSQGTDGSWSGRNDSLVLTTMNLTVLQLDSTSLPIYRRPAMK